MRVCHFSTVHHVEDSRVFHRECVSLAKHFEVTLIAIGKHSGYVNGVKVIAIEKPKSFLKRFTLTAFRVFKEAVYADAQVYHIHDAEMIPYGIVLSLSGKKVIYDIHENTYRDILLKTYLPLWYRKLASMAYKGLLKVSSNFLHFVVVAWRKEYLKDFFVDPNTCHLVQNFADPNQLRSYRVNNRSNLSGNHIFYLGMIRDLYYDIDPLFEAMYLLKQKGIEVHLHLAGYYGIGAKQSHDHLAFFPEIASQVTFYGKLEMQKAYEISKKCKVGICLKNQPDEALVSHERKLFEYISVGLPSIFCHSHIYRELNELGPIGVSVDLKSSQEIAEALMSILRHSHKLDEISENCLRLSDSKINWQFEFEKMLAIYHTI